ncbi:MAG: hypothetical protein MRY79_04535 [Alphaproteobacteria bacterium]|nr:hypothetical protein [Alphaproteobacteria bacterium]
MKIYNSIDENAVRNYLRGCAIIFAVMKSIEFANQADENSSFSMRLFNGSDSMRHYFEQFVPELLTHALHLDSRYWEEVKDKPDNCPDWLTDEKWNSPNKKYYQFNPPVFAPEIDRDLKFIFEWIWKKMEREPGWPNAHDVAFVKKLGGLDDIFCHADQEITAWNKKRLKDKFNYINRQQRLTGTVSYELPEEIQLPEGYEFVELKEKEAFEYEALAVQHCLDEPQYFDRSQLGTHRYFSLRDKNGSAHATIEVKCYRRHDMRPSYSTLLQCKGKQNQPPDEKYFPVLRKFYKSLDLQINNGAHAGAVKWQGDYFSIRRMPDGYVEESGNLDLSDIRGIQLPKEFTMSSVGWLVLNMEDFPTIKSVFEGGDIKVHLLDLKKKDKHKRLSSLEGPAHIKYNARTRSIHFRWYVDGKEIDDPQDDSCLAGAYKKWVTEQGDRLTHTKMFKNNQEITVSSMRL